MRATYDVGDELVVLREDVDLRGAEAVLNPEVVGARCSPVLVDVDDDEVALEGVRRVYCAYCGCWRDMLYGALVSGVFAVFCAFVCKVFLSNCAVPEGRDY